MSWKLLIASKSGKILCHLCFPLHPVGGRLFNFVRLSFPPPPKICDPVLIVVMGKEVMHGGGLNLKAHGMAEHLRKAGY